MKERTYVCCDLKSFYASVECVERGLDPMTTNLVVADKRRTEKTICLAVTPSLKAYGISGRARLFEVVQRVAEVNAQRRWNAPGHQFSGSSWNDPEVRRDPSLELDYIVAPPRMAHYIDWSTRIYQVYLKYIAPEDIYPYSIDEVFMDITDYLDTYKMTARELTRTIILDILKTTGITAAAGMGTNLYLAKASMDIVAKHVHADKDGVRIAKLNEMTYRRLLWNHRPLTDFWRVGKGYAAKLEGCGLYTMGDIARCSIGKPTDYHNEELLYQLFGVNAELLIDHAWGWEPCTIADVKAYKPEHKSIVSGQVLQCPYTFEKARLVVREMADALALDLVDKGLATNQLVLTVGYDIENLSVENHRYQGPVTTDRYGRKIPKHAVGTENFDYTSSANDLLRAVCSLYDRIVDRDLLIRRLSISANRLLDESAVPMDDGCEQMDLFTDYADREKQKAEASATHARERRIQETMLDIKKKYGKNAILKGMNLEEGATAKEHRRTSGMTGPYDDMLNLPHPTSRRHPRMSLSDRAAQFAPFAALSGHSAALVETARLTERRIELDEDVKAALDLKQQMLVDRIDEHPDVSVTWFQPDGKKDGGRYVTTTGRLKRIDEVERVLVMEDKTTVPLDDIISIDECRSPDFTSDL